MEYQEISEPWWAVNGDEPYENTAVRSIRDTGGNLHGGRWREAGPHEKEGRPNPG